MSKIRNSIYLIVIAMLLVSACTTQAPATTLPATSVPTHTVASAKLPSTSTPEPTRVTDPTALAAMNKCANILPGQACLVEGPVQVTAQPERSLMPFEQPGQVINLADLQTLKLGEDGSEKGLVVMRIQTEWPGGAFDAHAFGHVELVNEVPYGTREFNPMQSMKLATGPNQEGQTPTSGLFVSSPEDGNLSTLVVNDAELSFGSTGLLTSAALGGLTIQTMWGDIAIWYFNELLNVTEGYRLDLSQEEIKQQAVERSPYYDHNYEMVLKKLEEMTRILREQAEGEAYMATLWANRKNATPDVKQRMMATLIAKMKLIFENNKSKQKPWKGGWWKMTYGPVAVSGKCKSEAAGDGGVGGDGQPYTTEIPICRGNNGNTILMYESGVSYDRIRPNLYAKSFISEFDLLGNGNSTIEGRFMTLQVVSPTRMILSSANAEADGCTTTSAVYLDFVRDDPNIRCGQIIYINPYKTPRPPTPTPVPQKVEPPVKGKYQVRLGRLSKTCDPAAQPFAPSFTSAGLSLSAENMLVVDTASTKYELELSNLTYPYDSDQEDGQQVRYGIFTLQQPVDNSFNLTMSLFQMPDQQWSGNWLVANEDASKLCAGSIDLFPPN